MINGLIYFLGAVALVTIVLYLLWQVMDCLWLFAGYLVGAIRLARFKRASAAFVPFTVFNWVWQTKTGEKARPFLHPTLGAMGEYSPFTVPDGKGTGSYLGTVPHWGFHSTSPRNALALMKGE